MNSLLRFDILQHPSETKAAKNTARLLALCHQGTKIWVGETPEDFAPLMHEIDTSHRQTLLLYPGDNAITIEEYRQDTTDERTTATYTRILLLDGTWKKAFKIKQLNPWLNTFPSISIENQTSRYVIRQTKHVRDSLSTIEAAEYCIQKLEPEVNTRPLLTSLNKIQSNYLQRAGKNYT